MGCRTGGVSPAKLTGSWSKLPFSLVCASSSVPIFGQVRLHQAKVLCPDPPSFPARFMRRVLEGEIE